MSNHQCDILLLHLLIHSHPLSTYTLVLSSFGLNWDETFIPLFCCGSVFKYSLDLHFSLIDLSPGKVLVNRSPGPGSSLKGPEPSPSPGFRNLHPLSNTEMLLANSPSLTNFVYIRFVTGTKKIDFLIYCEPKSFVNVLHSSCRSQHLCMVLSLLGIFRPCSRERGRERVTALVSVFLWFNTN